MSGTMSNGARHYGPDWMREYADAIWNTQSWLYGPWTKEKYNAYVLLGKVPVFNDYMDYLLDIRRDSEYLTRYGMDYSDIHDPRGLRASHSGGRLVGSAFNIVSRNIGELYR